MRDKLGRFVKGYSGSPETEFKKGDNMGENNAGWKGGRRLDGRYWMVNVPGHPKAYRNEVYEHVLVAEEKIGRYLEGKECVHHINEDKTDNSPENLVVCKDNGEHIRMYHSNRKEKACQ